MQTTSTRVQMATTSPYANTFVNDDDVDYGYEDHYPDAREESDDDNDDNNSNAICEDDDDDDVDNEDTFDVSLPSRTELRIGNSGGCNRSNNSTTLPHMDATEVSQSPSTHECTTVTFADLNECDFPPMPPDRQARKQRSFRRRGGAVHSVLLKSAVMASMMDCACDSDDGGTDGIGNNLPNHRRGSCHSSISLQSLQDALRNESTSPRKRARRVRRFAEQNNDSSSPDEDDMYAAFERMTASSSTGVNNKNNNASSIMMPSANIMNNNNNGENDNIRKDFRREPPVRRVSRKTSYDSRVSDFDSEFSDWDDEI